MNKSNELFKQLRSIESELQGLNLIQALNKFYNIELLNKNKDFV